MAVDQSCVLFNDSTYITQDVLFLGTSEYLCMNYQMYLNGYEYNYIFQQKCASIFSRISKDGLKCG